MEFFLHNEEGIQFPSIRPAYKSGQLYFERFIALTPRDAHDSIIGKGGTGLIHLARDEVMDRLIALKLLHDDISRDPAARMDVIRETRQAMELTHPNIVRIHDFHEGAEGWGISMQYVDGKNLDEWRHDGATTISQSIVPYPVERIEDWIRQLCAAVAYAHEDAKMVHRDIKPKNLMLERHDDGSEKLLLTDFGITQKLSMHTLLVSRAQPKQDDKSALGTLPYMPWQQLEDEQASIYDDIYAIGATIYELITGRPPFYEGSYDQIRHQIEKVVPPSMADRLESFDLTNSGIPHQWEEVVADCLAKNIEDRPKSVRDIAHRLGLSSAPAIAQRVAPPANPNNEETAKLKIELEDTLKELSSFRAIADEKSDKISQQEQDIQRLQDQLAGGEDGAEALNEELNQLRAHLSAKEQEVHQWQTSYKDLEASKEGDSQEAIEQLRTQIQEREAELKNLAVEKTDLTKELTNIENRRAAESRELEALRKKILESDAAIAHAESSKQQIQQEKERDVAKARKLARESIDDLKKLKNNQRAALTPLLLILMVSLFVGIGAGAIVAYFNGADEEMLQLPELKEFTQIPEAKGDTGALITAKLFKQFTTESRISEQDLNQMIPGFSKLAEDSPVTGVSFLMAESFCGWLTSRALSDEDIRDGLYFRLAKRHEITPLRSQEDETPPEWAGDVVTSQPGRPIISSTKNPQGKWTPQEHWQVPSARATLDNVPLSFRVTLDRVN